MPLLDFLTDSRFVGPAFAEGDWSAWRTFLAALRGEPMSHVDAQAALVRRDLVASRDLALLPKLREWFRARRAAS